MLLMPLRGSYFWCCQTIAIIFEQCCCVLEYRCRFRVSFHRRRLQSQLFLDRDSQVGPPPRTSRKGKRRPYYAKCQKSKCPKNTNDWTGLGRGRVIGTVVRMRHKRTPSISFETTGQESHGFEGVYCINLTRRNVFMSYVMCYGYYWS